MKAGATTADGGSEFRVTFDSNILCRETELTLASDPYGTAILEEGMFLMELKCPGAIPLWMTKILSEERIYKTSFSKYGRAYCSFMEKTPSERSREIAAAGYMGWAAAQNERAGLNSRAGISGHVGINGHAGINGHTGRHFGKEVNASRAGSRRTRKRFSFGGRATA